MKNIVFCIALAFLSVSAWAGGDKNRKASPVFTDDECSYQAPPGIDIDEDCDLVTDHSGKAVYFCNEDLVVICIDD